MNPPFFRDAELLSVYLDGQLSKTDAARLEARLKTDPELRTVYEQLRQSRSLLRSLPARRAPHNFMLTPGMAGIRPPLPAAFPIFRLASVFAALLLFVGYAIDLSLPVITSTGAAAPAFAYGRGGAEAPAGAAPASAAASSAAASMGVQVLKMPPAAATQGIAATQLAATPTPEIAADLFAATATASLENSSTTPLAAGSGGAPLEATPFEKHAPAPVNQSALQPGAEEIPQPLPVSPPWLFGFLAAAVLSGAGALFVRYRTDAHWLKAHALKSGRISARDLLIFGVVLLVILLLAAAIYWISTATF